MPDRTIKAAVDASSQTTVKVNWKSIVGAAGNGAKAIFSPIMPATVNTASSMAGAMKDLRDANRLSKTSASQQKSAIKNSSENKKAVALFNAAMNDISSGSYDVDKISNDLGDDYDSLKDNFTMPTGDDAANMSSEEIILTSNAGVAKSVMQSGNAQLRGMQAVSKSIINSKKIDNIHSFIENNLSANIDFIKDVTSKFSDLKFKNDKGEELNFADVIDLKTLTKGNQETLVSNLEFIKDNISYIKVNDETDINLINSILNTPNKEIQDGYDLHSYIKDYVFNTKNEPLSPYKNIESNDELNIYLAGFKDENGKTIFDITAAYKNKDLTARSAYELAHQTDLPAEYKEYFLILYGSNTPALNDAISLYGKLNKLGLAHSHDYETNFILINLP